MRVFGVVGWKNCGKTTLVERLVAELVGRGHTVSTVKHTHHAVDLDRPGKDTHRHRDAGAQEVMLASSARWALMRELRGTAEPPLASLIARMAPVDLVLVEGFKGEAHDKIEAHRADSGHELIARTDPTVRAVASDTAHDDLGKPLFHLDEIGAIADFVARSCGLLRLESVGR